MGKLLVGGVRPTRLYSGGAAVKKVMCGGVQVWSSRPQILDSRTTIRPITDGTSSAVNLPPAAVGQRLVMVTTMFNNGTAPAVSAPGWNIVGSFASPGGAGITVLTRVATGTEGASVQVSGGFLNIFAIPAWCWVIDSGAVAASTAGTAQHDRTTYDTPAVSAPGPCTIIRVATSVSGQSTPFAWPSPASAAGAVTAVTSDAYYTTLAAATQEVDATGFVPMLTATGPPEYAYGQATATITLW